MQKLVILILLTLISKSFLGQSAAVTLLDQSITFHDPHDQWKDFEGILNFRVLRKDKPDGRRKVKIDNKDNSFYFWAQYNEGVLHYQVEKNQGLAFWNGQEKVPEAIAEKFKIREDRAVMYRDYYTYLYGMPMKLKDPGTIIDPDVEQVDFYGSTYDRIRVTYTEGVGEDIWYFYFNPQTHALEAYQFFHDESKNDGEYILFKETKEIDGVKIPRIREWYYNKDKAYLATDVLE